MTGIGPQRGRGAAGEIHSLRRQLKLAQDGSEARRVRMCDLELENDSLKRQLDQLRKNRDFVCELSREAQEKLLGKDQEIARLTRILTTHAELNPRPIILPNDPTAKIPGFKEAIDEAMDGIHAQLRQRLF